MPKNSLPIILYGRPGCLMVKPVTEILNEAEATFEYVDIWQDERARARVQRINGGAESVPTVVFPDGSSLTEPGESLLRQKLAKLGYEIDTHVSFGRQLRGWLRNPAVLIVAGLLIFYLLRVLEVI